MKNLKLLLGPMRLPFVILAPACVLVGLGTALYEQGSINWGYFLLALIGAISAHISVNAFNEYFDFKSGLDTRTQKTPFSGGSGTLQAHPELASAALWTAIVTFVLTGLIGLFFAFVQGWEIIPLGVVGLFLLYGYTVWITRVPILCLLAPGLGFGTLMVLGTHFALTGSYSWTALLASFVPFFLVSDLLLLNQFPDVEADESIGRKHYPIVLGRKKSSYLYIAFLLGAYVAIVLGVVLGLLPTWALLGLLTLILAMQVIRNLLKNAENVPAILPSMAQNVLINLITPVLLAIGLLIG
ncbi:MAG: prenyltransferase [Anaerolineales bacterium]|nr:prenyltransferase [Anaerolineales bacterium]MCX7609038.1 prenyltransferase [Anaerolineales bacterium]MDW8226623.1 prenyltransferase [Anaerolineales bacterium]